MRTELLSTRFPKVPLGRRCAAFAIDFIAVWLVSLPFAGMTPGFPWAQLLVFVVAWLGMRVILVSKNRGQSLGRYALDMKVIDAKFGKTAGLTELAKREGITLFGALLATIGLNIGFSNGISLLLLISPLAADGCVALADPDLQQTLHDRLAKTMIVASRRGYSLDLRAKRLLAQFQQRMK